MFTRTESFREFIRYYPVVSMIVGVHILLYLLTVLPVFPNRLLFEVLAGVNIYIAEGEYWRLFTPILLHSGFAHMLFNSFSLVLFGPALEQIIGKTKFLLLYFSAGIAANIATFVIKPLTYVHVGSSGAIFGLFGFYMSILLFKKHLLTRQNSQIILSITAIGLIMTFVQANINVTAHLFGFLSGLFIGTVSFKDGQGGLLQTIKNMNWSTRKRNMNFERVSFAKLIIWGALILLVLIGIMNR